MTPFAPLLILSRLRAIMKTKIISNENGKAQLALVNNNETLANLDLTLLESTKGKDGPFKYWAHETGSESTNDLNDIRDWITALNKAGVLDNDADSWIKDACLYRLNNGKYKTVQKKSIDGQRIDSYTDDEKLSNIAQALDGDAFKERAKSDGKAALTKKLEASENRAQRMQEIFSERRALEAKHRKEKSAEKADAIQAKIDALDVEADALFA